MNSPTVSPFDVRENTWCVCVCAARMPASSAVVPPAGSPARLPFASAPPISDAVAVADRCSPLTSIPKGFEPGANLFDFQAQYSVTHGGGASIGGGLPSAAG